MDTEKKSTNTSENRSSPHRRHRDVDIFREVHEFIDKDRQQLEMDALSKQHETEAWKGRYDDLVDKVSRAATLYGDYSALEILGDRKGTSAYEASRILNRNVIRSEDDWVVDLSGKTIKSEELKSIANDSTRLHSYANTKVFRFSRCCLSDIDSPALCRLMKNPNFVAFDLSHNDLGAEFLAQLIDTMKVGIP